MPASRSTSAVGVMFLFRSCAGRLIRSTGDKGVVAVLDSRLATERYAGFLRGALPPFWSTTDRSKALAALIRLGAEASG